MSETFSKRRIEKANEEFEAYDFGDATVNSFDGWDYTMPGTEYTRTVWFENTEDPDGDDVKGHFTVTFESPVGFSIAGVSASINGNDIGARGIVPIQHPLPVGTIIKVKVESTDSGTMSWDDSDTEIDRVAPAGSLCVITAVEGKAPNYHVEFLPSEVWNILNPEDFATHPEQFEIIELGNGTVPASHSDYYADEDRERDPTAVEKIAAENAPTGPSI
jgi:hypothetical protein